VAKTKRIGEILREARLEKGLSARDLERLTGMGTGEISQIESGRRADPAFSVILRIARGIGISMEDLSLRFEGRPSGGRASTVSPAKAASALAKARSQHAKLGEALQAASDALHDGDHRNR
jgi:transcriptional regulator with XRE-family HTH domain